MRNPRWLSCLFASGVCLVMWSCDSSSDDGPSEPIDRPDSGLPVVENPDPINEDCPLNEIGPTEGQYALKGACCYRTSNKARIDEESSMRTLEYRMPYFMLINHKKSIDPALFGPTSIERFENEEQNLLIRVQLPQEGGKLVQGKGKLKIGPGRYNCDGTYSFYSDKAAPTDSGPADRWFVPELDLDITDPEAMDRSLVTAPFKSSLAVSNRTSSLPYIGPLPGFELEWEGKSQGFDFLELPISEDNYDCVGKREGSKWTPGAKTMAFARLDVNEDSAIDALGGISFCQLMAFGARADAPSCSAERCTPGEAGCKWVRLPDSLCPVTDDDKAKWGCHLGYDGNPDNEPLETNCTAELPDEIDPDKGTPEGQCCDPLGREDSGLPACNAWAQINDIVLAAVEITDKLADELQENCRGK